jgi:methyl-accepting chemotaxis protein
MDLKKKLNRIFLNSPVYLGLLVFATILSFEIIGYWLFEKNILLIRTNATQLPPDSFYIVGKIFILICIAGCLLAFLVILMLRRGIVIKNQSLEKIIKTGQILVKKDCASLTTSIAELAQGNLTVDLSVQSKSIPLLNRNSINPWIQAINSIIASLQEASRIFREITALPCSRLCYVGADSFLEGSKCGEVMGEALGGKGQVAISTGSLKAVGLELRRKGFESLIQEKYPEIRIVWVEENQENPEYSYSSTKDLIKKYPHLSGIYVTEGSTPYSVAKAVFDGGKSGKVKIVSHDLTDETMRYVREGVITATLGQDPFAQGHDPVIHLFNYLVADWKPPTPRLLTQMDVVTSDNYQKFWKEGIGVIKSLSDHYAKPIQKISKEPLKIIVLGRENSSFWYPVREGVLAAGRELEPFNVKVEWTLPETKTNEIKASDFKQYFDRVIAEGYHGLSTISPDKEMVPYINKIVDSGIPVITFNSEPASIRGLVYTITEQAKNLMGLSEKLASSANQVNMATTQINDAMHEMSRGAVSQNEDVNRTQEAVKSLLTNIEQVNREAKEGAKTSVNTAQAVGHGTDAMGKTLTGMQTIEKSVEDTWRIVEELGKHSEQIDTIVEMIDDIASRVNVLALNAAVEATRAGDYGKGFMVVANEIRKLAKNTASATQEVTELVSTVQNSIHKVEKVMSGGLDQVKESTQMTGTAQNSLQNIKKLVEMDKERMQKIAGTIMDMQRFSNQVGEAMETVAVVSEKNAETVGQVNTATQQVSTQLGDLATLAQLLEQMSRGEQQLLAKFNLSGNAN